MHKHASHQEYSKRIGPAISVEDNRDYAYLFSSLGLPLGCAFNSLPSKPSIFVTKPSSPQGLQALVFSRILSIKFSSPIFIRYADQSFISLSRKQSFDKTGLCFYKCDSSYLTIFNHEALLLCLLSLDCFPRI